MRIAVDFDGTLCEFAFPKIGKQTQDQKELMETLIQKQKEGDNEQYPVLTEAIEWCRERGLEFDAVNENLPGQKKLSGPSPKVMADVYIDDLALNIKDWRQII
jgi:hypothetical protein